jgi:hypothetical protein
MGKGAERVRPESIPTPSIEWVTRMRPWAVVAMVCCSGLGGSACGAPTSVVPQREAPVVTASAADSAAPPAPTSEPSAADEPPPPGTVERIEPWGIELFVPEGKTLAYDSKSNHAEIALGLNQTVVLERIDAAAPKTLEEAAEYWDQRASGDDLRVLDQGKTEQGAMFAVRAFQARVGVPSGPRGGSLHRWKWFTRVLLVWPVASDRHIRCMGYLEYGDDITMDDAGVQQSLAICRSLREAKAPGTSQ